MRLVLNKHINLFFAVCMLGLFVGCQSQSSNGDHAPSSNFEEYPFPYDFSEGPSKEFKMPKILTEISGLTVWQDKYLICVQDEIGKLFFLSPKSGKLKREVEFSADGDYEDISSAGESLFALRADGVLFLINDWKKKDKANTSVIPTPLSEENNTEGLGYDFATNTLLLACKDSPHLDKKGSKSRAIYSYNLDSMVFERKATYKIKRKELKRFLKDSPNDDNYKKVRKHLKVKKSVPFQPSAIAVHPISGDIYILSSVGRALMILNRKNEIKHIQHLPSKHFEQPEGLAFMTNGDMFIASEGQKKKGRIYRFDWKQP